MKAEPGPPMTLGNAAKAELRFILWCRGCRHQIEPDPGQLAEQHGLDTPVLDWRVRLCSKCRGREVDLLVTA